MRETSVRGPAIDLGEFERRLRGPERAPQVEDPLSELARLVQGQDHVAADPYSQILAEARDARVQAAELRGSYDAAPPVAAEPPYYPEPSLEQPLEPAYPVDPDYRDLPPGYSPQQGAGYEPTYQGAGYESAYHEAQAGWSDDSQYLDYGQSDEDYEDPHGGWRSWFRPWHAVVAISLVAVLSIGFAFWHRSGSGASREIATIVAPEGPVKVKPSAEAETTAPDASAAVVLDRREQAPVQKVVTNQEQAVDPSVTPSAALLGDGPVNLPHEPPAPATAAPKKVKTVTVRPDGSRVEDGALPPAVAMASRPAAETAAPTAVAGAIGAATATPPTQAKPTATPPRIAKPKPVAPKVAAVEGAAAPEADSDQATPPSKGGFAVQFGAANSEADARELLKTVVSKYRSQLGGLKPTFKMATVNDKTVYRVRVGAVSKESANAICSKVKASGGSCFVAGN
ncbi:SPOR domain-containing protein [Methylocystis sp. L43]|uniref:SPOR domain-containing protein n=1 Tax=unclassified Methylocystis TaxID=2625913 RepID=UPI0018C21688|nr:MULTISPECIES: SPOR domain-containing protein [unclassified Methylocystis]MBG0797150.1 SPOR domain-containing protein [Methylocystis sp. L43]MBG0804979.1 SPOR domain-containing protein [Methylocystis sp. H15]